MTLYDALGVGGEASADEVRDAYRRLARQHHPDRGGRDPAAMAALNEAYRVLGHPARRAAYDQSLRGVGVGARRVAADRTASPSPPRARAPVPRVDPLPPARYPWPLVIGMFVLGVAIVLVGVALYKPAAESPPDNLLGPGSCVVIEANGDAREVNCGGDDDLVVQALISIDEQCPTGTAGYRDRQGRGLACVPIDP
ncbi:MAG: J domain-containing protein [Ilumatobacteraceae bacterium]